ncbi:hypothetical protein QJQ45_029581, partial [Haematococcus lacustris]
MGIMKACMEVAMVPLLEMSNYLAHFPLTQQLIKVVRASPKTSTKTPLSLLNEYAGRLTLEVVFKEEGDAVTGPFTTTVLIQSRGSEPEVHASGIGKGRNKRDARQVAAAACVEAMLQMDEEDGGVQAADFLGPPKQPGTSSWNKRNEPKPGLGFSANDSGGVVAGYKKRRDNSDGFSGSRVLPSMGTGRSRYRTLPSTAHAGGAAAGTCGVPFTRAQQPGSVPEAFNRDKAEIVMPPDRPDTGDPSSSTAAGRTDQPRAPVMSLRAYEPGLAQTLLGTPPTSSASARPSSKHAPTTKSGGAGPSLAAIPYYYSAAPAQPDPTDPAALLDLSNLSVAQERGQSRPSTTGVASRFSKGASGKGNGSGSGWDASNVPSRTSGGGGVEGGGSGGGGGVWGMTALQAGLPETLDDVLAPALPLPPPPTQLPPPPSPWAQPGTVQQLRSQQERNQPPSNQRAGGGASGSAPRSAPLSLVGHPAPPGAAAAAGGEGAGTQKRDYSTAMDAGEHGGGGRGSGARAPYAGSAAPGGYG